MQRFVLFILFSAALLGAAILGESQPGRAEGSVGDLAENVLFLPIVPSGSSQSAALAPGKKKTPTPTPTVVPATPSETPTTTQTPPETSHAGRYTTYEGSSTCIGCHQEEVSEVHASAHYQWNGYAIDVPGMETGGKLGGMNDFCGNPDINWIGQMTNLDGQTVDGGCATCHTGLGLKPNQTADQEQLENIDCLVCHSDSYKRKVEMVDGSYRFVPAPERMQVDLLTAITDVQLPSRASCLACHAKAGGGNNNKRGDLELAHADPPSAEFDVHMAGPEKGGAGLVCTDCHTVSDHRIAGRGSDLRETDLDEPVQCTNCHPGQPHDDDKLDRHTDRVDCSVCHIPTFAKITSTDMYRDYRHAEVVPATQLYEPALIRQSNVTPEYLFWNGQSSFYILGEQAVLGPNGRVVMSAPLGSISDPLAKIYAFKHHLATQPVDNASGAIIPAKMGILFQTGDVDSAIVQGAAALGWDLPQGYDFIETERYLGIFHGVTTEDHALECADCHEGDQMDFAALGYTPKETRNGQPLCTSCHNQRNDQIDFYKMHDKHVRDKGFDCAECHNIPAQ